MRVITGSLAMVFVLAVSLLGSMLALATNAVCAEADWYGGPWAHEDSDLVPDSRIHFGRLPNGFRYALITNTLPPGRVSMYLNVQVGSLMEEEFQQGYAHFVEHMAFNGSKHFPAGSLIPFFQQNGMSFGGDTNAHTSLAETVYKLNLARTDTETLRTGLRVLRDFADGLTFDEQEVEDERGVILSEKIARDNEQAQAGRWRRERLYHGTHFARDTIGTEECISGATRDGLLAFYQKWYRPERMVLVVVGDLAVESLPELIEEQFSSITAKGPAPVTENWGTPEAPPLRAIFHKRPVTGSTVSIMAQHPREYPSDSVAFQTSQMIQSVAALCVNQRLSFREETEPGIWSRAVFQDRSRQGFLPTATLFAVSDADAWKNALSAVVDEWRTILAEGFSDAEIVQAKKMLRAGLERKIKLDASLPSDEVASQIILSINTNRVHTSAVRDLEIFDAAADSITPEAAMKSLIHAFSPDNKTIYVSSNMDISEQEILEQWQAALDAPLKARLASEHKKFPYLPLPPQVGTLPELKERQLAVNAPRLYSAVLENGMTIHLVPTDYEKNRVEASLLFHGGFFDHADAEATSMRVARNVLNASGLGALSVRDVRQTLAPLGVSVTEGIGNRNSTISGSSPSPQVESLLQAIWTQYTDPHPTEYGRTKFLQELELKRHKRFHTVDGVDEVEGRSFFFGPALRFAPVEKEDAAAVSLEEVKAIIAESRTSGPSHLIVSGDFDKTAVLDMAVRLFSGYSPPRKHPQNVSLPVFPADTHAVRLVGDTVDKAVLRMAWRHDVADETDRRRHAVNQVFLLVLRDRLHKEIREKMGAAYSPSAIYPAFGKDGAGFSLLHVIVGTTPELLPAVRMAIESITKNMVEHGVGQEEVDRLRLPLLTSHTTSRKTRKLWHNLVQAELQYDEPRVQWSNEYADLIASITAEEVAKEAEFLFTKAQTASITIKSETVKP